MTREEILNMPAGREMDALIAERVWGIVSNPHTLSDSQEVWFWVHPKDGVLIGEPFDIGGSAERTERYAHQWERFCPSTDIADAWEVFMWLFVRGVVHFSNGDGDSFDITFSPTKNKDATHTIKSDLHACQVTDDNFPRLVCRAALLATFA